MIVADIVPYE